MSTIPTVSYRQAQAGEELSSAIGMALDELVYAAREAGASEDDLRERVEDAFDRYSEDTE